MQPENNRSNNQQTSSHHYDPFNYPFFPPSNAIIQTNNQSVSQNNNKTNLMTQHPYAHLLQTNSSQSIFFHKIKEHPVQTLYNLLKEDFEILHFHIYLLTLYIK